MLFAVKKTYTSETNHQLSFEEPETPVCSVTHVTSVNIFAFSFKAAVHFFVLIQYIFCHLM